MILSGEWLIEAMKASGKDEFPLFSVDKLLVGIKPVAFIEPLIEHGIVYGQGSKANVRKVFMKVEMDEADRVIAERERGNRRERAASPLDLIRRYCADRKTTKRAGKYVLRNGRVVYATWYEHKANAGLRFDGEMLERERLARG